MGLEKKELFLQMFCLEYFQFLTYMIDVYHKQMNKVTISVKGVSVNRNNSIKLGLSGSIKS